MAYCSTSCCRGNPAAEGAVPAVDPGPLVLGPGERHQQGPPDLRHPPHRQDAARCDGICQRSPRAWQ